MKKILILILIIIIIVGGVFVYKYFQNNDNELKKIETNQLTTVLSSKKKNYFLMYIDEVSEDNSNIMIKGTILRGNIKVNDAISIVGLDKKEITTKVLRINNEESDMAKEGDSVSLVLESDMTENYITAGQAVIKTGTAKPIYNIVARLNAISTDNIFKLEGKVNTFSINTDVKCSVKVLSKENSEIRITLDVPIVIDDGIEFSLKDDDKVIAKGIAID